MKEGEGRFLCASSNEVEKKTLWPSKMDMIEKCPASAEVGDLDVIIDQVGGEANLGQAIHDIASRVVSGEEIEIDRDYLLGVATRYGVDDNMNDVLSLAGATVVAWASLKKYFRNPSVELSSRLERQTTNPHTGANALVVLSGKHDVCEVFDVDSSDTARKWAVNLDWKTSRKADESSYKSQMLAYSLLMIAQDDRIDQVTTIIVWLRDKTYSTTTFTRKEIVEWFDSFIKRSAFWDGKTFRPGDHCMWCKRFYVCPARITMVSSAIKTFSHSDVPTAPMILNPDGSLVDPSKLYMAYEQGKLLDKMLSQFFSQVREEVIKRGKVTVRKEGDREIGFYTKKKKGTSSIDPVKAWEKLEEVFTEDELAKLVDISASRVHKAAMGKASRGNKTKFADSVLDDLEKAGAVVRSPDVISVHAGYIEGDNSD